MVAERVKKTRDEHWEDRTDERAPAAAHHGHRASGRRDARQRRELPHQKAFHRAGHRSDRKSGPYLTLLHGPQFGDLIWQRRRHDVPAGSCRTPTASSFEGSNMAECHPVGFRWVMKAKRARRDHHPCRPAIHADQRRRGYPRAHPRGQRHRLSRRHHSLHPRERALFQRVRCQLHQCRRDHQRRISRTRKISTASSAAGITKKGKYDLEHWMYEGVDPEAAAGRANRVRRRPNRAEAADPGRTHRPDAAASALRVPDSEAALLAATRRRWSRRPAAFRATCSCKVAETLCRNSGRERTGGVLLRGWLDAAHGRACNIFGRRRSSSCCWEIWAGRAAASWRCAVMRPSRARPIFRRSIICCRAICRCRKAQAR